MLFEIPTTVMFNLLLDFYFCWNFEFFQISAGSSISKKNGRKDSKFMVEPGEFKPSLTAGEKLQPQKLIIGGDTKHVLRF
jgi:hypothetical protein